MMIKFYINPLIILLLFAGVFALAEDEFTIDDFKIEYASYQRLSEAGNWAASLGHAKRSYEMGMILFGEASKNTSALAYNYGLNLMELKKNEEAEPVLREALKMYERVYGEDSKELIPVLMDLGHSIAEPYQGEAQKIPYRRALKLLKKHYGENSIEYALRSVEVGVSMFLRAQSIWAKEYLYNGYKILEKKLGEEDIRTGYAAFNIGKYELAIYNYKEAISYFNKALTSFSAPNQPSTKFELSAHGFLVQAYEKLDKRDMATRHCLAIGRMTPTADVQNYQPLVRVTPEYPESALQRRQEGYVILEYEVDDFGFVKNPRVVDIKGPKVFADVSIKAAEKFRYAPSFKDGRAVITEGVKNRFTFEISD